MVLVAFLAAACPSRGGDAGDAQPASRAHGSSGGSSGGTPGGSAPETTPRPAACALRSFPAVQTCRGATGPWAEALQKALWFFHANRCGSGRGRAAGAECTPGSACPRHIPCWPPNAR